MYIQKTTTVIYKNKNLSFPSIKLLFKKKMQYTLSKYTLTSN